MAVARLWLQNDSGIQIVSMTEDRLKETLLLMRDSFYTDEPPAKGVELQSCPEAIDELENLTVETFRDGVSVIALQNDKVVGALFNKIQTNTREDKEDSYFEHFKQYKCQTDTAKEYVDCMIRMDAKKDVFVHYGVDRILEVMFLAVLRSARGLGIGRMLVQASVDVARDRCLPVISAIFTSCASQRIGQSLQWDQLVTVPMSEHIFRGTPYSTFTGDDQSQILMAHLLQK